MPSDNPVAKRNALVIPAGLVLFYCAVAILYAELIRSDATLCRDGGKILVRDVCYNVWKLMLPLLLIAFGVLLGGALGFRTKRTGMTADLYHGSGAHFVMALLASFVAVPLLGLVVQFLRERTLGTTFVIEAYDIAFEHVFLLGVATLVGAMMFLPYLVLYLHQDRRRRRFLEVAHLPSAEAVRQPAGPPEDEEQGMWAPLEEEWVDQGAWAEGREAWPGSHAALPEAPPVPEAARPSPARRPQLPGETPLSQPPLTEKDDAEFQEGIFLAGVVDAETAGRAPAPAPTPAPAAAPAEPEVQPAPKAGPAPDEAPPAPEVPAPPPPGRAAPAVEAAVDRLHEPPSRVPGAVDRLQEKPEEPKPAPYFDYPDVSRPVAELPGVDRAAAKLLDSAGIRTTARLRYEDDAAVSHAAGVPRDRVRAWKREAELLCVPGIGPAYAHALVQAGVTGVDDLKRLAAETIHKRVGAANPAFTVKRIQSWQDNARGLRRVRQPVPDE